MAAGDVEHGCIRTTRTCPPEQRHVHHGVNRARARELRIADGAKSLEVIAVRVKAACQHVRGAKRGACRSTIEETGLDSQADAGIEEETQIVSGGVVGPWHQLVQAAAGECGSVGTATAQRKDPHAAEPEPGRPIAMIVGGSSWSTPPLYGQ